jgi:hypothetical protein
VGCGVNLSFCSPSSILLLNLNKETFSKSIRIGVNAIYGGGYVLVLLLDLRGLEVVSRVVSMS